MSNVELRTDQIQLRKGCWGRTDLHNWSCNITSFKVIFSFGKPSKNIEQDDLETISLTHILQSDTTLRSNQCLLGDFSQIDSGEKHKDMGYEEMPWDLSYMA